MSGALAKEIREFRSPTDEETRMFYEIVVAPSYIEKGLEIICGKSKTLRILENNCMLGMGSGQPNRVESLRIAIRKARDDVKGAALVSDAFFPFAKLWKDVVEEACESGIGVIAEPGGSIRDQDAIDCCNKYGVSLLFTNVSIPLHPLHIGFQIGDVLQSIPGSLGLWKIHSTIQQYDTLLHNDSASLVWCFGLGFPATVTPVFLAVLVPSSPLQVPSGVAETCASNR
ncbi:hypothetical protein JHK82_025089 [Glycine max]|nr:hypothetical protein JHK82_025089 [Glycine max]